MGNKYGYRPIPNEISRPEFECLQAVARVNNDIRWTTVTDWYNLDENNTPSHYVLQPISLMIPHYNDSVSFGIFLLHVNIPKFLLLVNIFIVCSKNFKGICCK